MAHVDNLRRHFPAVRYVTYLNTGSFGCLPDVAVTAMRASLEKQLEAGRMHDHFEAVEEVKSQVRQELGRLLSAAPRSFALTHSTTEAINLALWGLDLQRDDEILISDIENPGAALPVINLRHRVGVKVKVFSGTLPDDELLNALTRQLNPRTRVVVCSHVSYATGHVLPIAKISEWCRHHRVNLVVDGAQSVGAIPVDLESLNVDFYALPGQKWSCGPDGTGALYVHPRHMDVLLPTIVGKPTLRAAEAYDSAGYFLPAPDARRFEHDLTGLETLIGWLEALQFMRVTVGLDYAYTRIHGLSGELLDGLLDIDGVRVVTPRDARAGLLHFALQKLSAATFVAEAKNRQIDVRAIDALNVVRVSTGFYNSSDDLQRLLRLTRELLGQD